MTIVYKLDAFVFLTNVRESKKPAGGCQESRRSCPASRSGGWNLHESAERL